MSGEKRAAWDVKKIRFFVFLELILMEEDVKFCRRLGERSDAPDVGSRLLCILN
jgi:hypothetical protein